MFWGLCEPRARPPLAEVEAARLLAAAPQPAASYSIDACPAPAKNTMATTTAETTPPREPPATPPIATGASFGAWNSSPATLRQEHPVLPSPASEPTRHCSSASHDSCPPEKIHSDLTFGNPPFSFDKTYMQFPNESAARVTPERTRLRSGHNAVPG